MESEYGVGFVTLPNTSQDNVPTNSLYSFPTISSFSSWVAAQLLAERIEPAVRGIEMGAASTRLKQVRTVLMRYIPCSRSIALQVFDWLEFMRLIASDN